MEAMNTSVNYQLAPQRRFISIKQAAEYLGLSANTLYSWNSQGIHLPVIKLGRRVLVDVNDLEAFIETNKKQPRDLDALGNRIDGRLQ